MLSSLKTPIVKTLTYSQIEITTVLDRFSERDVLATVVVEGIGPIQLTLWKDVDGDLAYTKAGQWTDSDVLARVQDLLAEQLK